MDRPVWKLTQSKHKHAYILHAWMNAKEQTIENGLSLEFQSHSSNMINVKSAKYRQNAY